MTNARNAWKWLSKSSGILAVFVAVPAALLATVQCSMVQKEVDRAEQLTVMTRQQLESARKTNDVQTDIAGSTERATRASVQAMAKSEQTADRLVAAAERSAAAAERSMRAVEASVALQRQMLAAQQRRN